MEKLTKEQEKEGQMLLNHVMENIRYSPEPWLKEDSDVAKQGITYIKKHYASNLINPDAQTTYHFYKTLPGMMKLTNLEHISLVMKGLISYLHKNFADEIKNGEAAMAIHGLNKSYDEKAALYGHNLLSTFAIYYIANDVEGSREELKRAANLSVDQIVTQLINRTNKLEFVLSIMDNVQDQKPFDYDAPADQQEFSSDFKFICSEYLNILLIVASEKGRELYGDAWFSNSANEFSQAASALSEITASKRSEIASRRMEANEKFGKKSSQLMSGLNGGRTAGRQRSGGSNYTPPKKKRK